MVGIGDPITYGAFVDLPDQVVPILENWCTRIWFRSQVSPGKVWVIIWPSYQSADSYPLLVQEADLITATAEIWWAHTMPAWARLRTAEVA